MFVVMHQRVTPICPVFRKNPAFPNWYSGKAPIVLHFLIPMQ